MTCEEFGEFLCTLSLQELASAPEIAQHLEDCDDCTVNVEAAIAYAELQPWDLPLAA